MYIPKEFNTATPQEVQSFLTEFPFGILLINGKESPIGSHVPFIFEFQEERLIAKTHLSIHNQQVKELSNQKALLIFNEPHGYVSPSLYHQDQPNVPTWNYVAIHLYGQIELVTEKIEKQNLLLETIQQFEPDFISKFDQLPAQYIDALISELIGVKISIDKVEAAQKLSQNKSKHEQETIQRYFSNQPSSTAKDLANYMKKSIQKQ